MFAYQAKNASGLILTLFFSAVFQDVHIMIFIGFGFLMTFLRHYSFSAVSLNLFISALAIQWSMLLRGIIGNHGGKKYVDINK